MNSPERSLLAGITERDIQLAMVQLVQTSASFQTWLFEQSSPEVGQVEFLGVSHSVEDYYGETDIEVRVRDEQGETHFLLIECKINAGFQSDQIERYVKRGRKYQEKGFCDSFSVVFFAPEAYTNEADSFDSVVTFEQVDGYLEKLSHDGGPFFRTLLRRGNDKQSGMKHERIDDRPIQQRIESRVYDRLDELAQIADSKEVDELLDIREPTARFRIHSNHPNHPEEIRYEVRPRFDKRVAICGIGVYNVDDKFQRRIYNVLARNFDGLHLDESQIKLVDDPLKSQGIVTQNIPIPSEPREVTDRQVDQVATAMIGLINHYHPRIIEDFQ